jgi:EmrB/QacA subfamily drug resistance transporter
MNKDATIKKATLLVVTMTSFMTPFMSSSVTVALPALGKEFLMNAILLSWVATSNLLAAAVFLVPFGKIADIYGRKKIFFYGISIFTLSSLLSGLAANSFWLILFRIIQGIGASMTFGIGVALITSVYNAEERGKALGINAAAVYSGLSLGPFLGGFLTDHFGWRSVFFANIPLGLIIITTIAIKLKQEWIATPNQQIDSLGFIIYAATLISIIYGFSSITKPIGLSFTLFGILCLFIFIKWEMHTKHPLLDIKLFKESKAFAYSNLAALINYSATFTVSFLLSLYIQFIKKLSPSDTGIILLVQPATMALLSPFSGWLSDKIEPRIVSSIGMALSAVSLFEFALLNSTTSINTIILNLFILGVGLALFASPNTNAVMSSVKQIYYGVASGMLGTMRVIGQNLSMTITMLILSIYLGSEKIHPHNYSKFITSTKVSFLIFGLLCIPGFIASLTRGNVRKN